MDKLPITVCIATMNEENNIECCIDKVLDNSPSEIIIIDAKSNDKTVLLSKKKGVKVILTEKKGLAWQRQVGIENATQPFIAMVDAQDRLQPDCLKILLEEMKNYNWKAIQAQLYVLEPKTYWQKGYELNSSLSLNIPGTTNMIGRPCIYESNAIKNVGFDTFFGFGVGCEDTDVSIQFELKGYKQGKGSGVSYRIFPSSFNSWFKKWLKYGKGDARIAVKYPHKCLKIFQHQLWEYPVVRGLRSIRNGGEAYYLFFFLFGVVRFFSCVQELINIKFLNHKFKTK